jgi:hypothetical protein
MKKIIFVLGLMFTLNTYGQDTTYFVRRQMLYRGITEVVTDSSSKYKVMEYNLKKRKRMDRTLSIVSGIVFGSLTIWYFKIIK